MIFLDYRGFVMAQIYGYASFIRDAQFDDDFFIQRCLINIGKLSKRYKKYGKLIIAADSSKRKYWRTLEFEHYKAGRYKEQENLSLKDKETKDKVRQIPNSLESVIQNNFPFYFIKSVNAEADDIIGTLVSHNRDQSHVILSADQDFMQLQRYNVVQYDTTRNRWLKTDTAEYDLQEKIFRGDSGDGIPNILSDADTFVTDKRQKAMTKKQLKYLHSLDFDKLLRNPEQRDTKLVKRYEQNRMLIDLSRTPLDVKQDIIEKFEAYGEPKNSVMNYCLKNKYPILFENLNLF